MTPKELENGKEQLKASFLLNMESMTNRMTRNGKNELIFGRHLPVDEILQKIDGISLDSVQKLIGKIFPLNRQWPSSGRMSKIINEKW